MLTHFPTLSLSFSLPFLFLVSNCKPPLISISLIKQAPRSDFDAYPSRQTPQSFTPMSSNRRKFHIKHPVVVDVGCSCRRPKLSSFFFSSAKKTHTNKTHTNTYPGVSSPSTASLSTATTNATSYSSFSPSNPTSSSPSQAFYSPPNKQRNRRWKKKKKKGVVEESVAVEKESADPYVDFRDSMLQMIVEKEIYGWDELRELLQLLLSLNSPHHHSFILQAFAEILNGVFLPADP